MANGIDGSLLVQRGHSRVDCVVESFGVSKGLMGQMMRLEIAPDNFDIVEFGCVFRQPLDGEPVFARLEGLGVIGVTVTRP